MKSFVMSEGIRRELSALLGGEYIPLQLQPRLALPLRRRARHWPISCDKKALLVSELRERVQPGCGFDSHVPEDKSNCSLKVLGRDAFNSLKRGDQQSIDYIERKLSLSKQEALYLLKSCDDYDFKFPVVFDRYCFKNTTIESLEKLKVIVYAIIAFVGDRETRFSREVALCRAYGYDQERLRKEMYDRQFKRTHYELEEETKLLSALKKLQGSQQILSENREALYQTLSIPSSSTTGTGFDGSQGLHSLAQLIITAERVKRKAIIAKTTNTNEVEVTNHSAIKKQKPTTANGEKFGIFVLEKSVSGVSLRSHRAMIGKGSAQKIASLLSELKLTNVLAFPTFRTTQGTDLLNRALVNLLDAKRVMERLNIETKVEITRKEKQL